ncbi:LysR family transcriptional regulator [Bradyrhizobium diazoefficiens]|uniref:LysR family transcriptional regulator n=1 Tax=Bradyrhizobium diazoefficiens TaxID=1355477 RepID=UPI00190B17BF|nr:LysR family transcriptional regulator [Bradyrhizobium diazoefficiens]QQO33123.1 LysR family transcriptional regulator [Bradyrhizobium diazoefficiens]
MEWSDLGRRISLRDLNILIAVADTGSMAKAAARLRISHPAVSKTISELEGALGARLLDRSPQGVQLTPSGEVLLRCGVNIFDELRQGYRSLEYLSDPNSGEVRLGCTEIILHGLASAIVRKFSAKYPGVQVDVKLANPGEHQLRELRERRIDLLITRATGKSAAEDLHSEMLFDEPFVFIVGAASEFARKRRVVLSEIISRKWVLPAPDSAPGALINDVFRAAGFQPPNAVVKTISIELTTSLVASGEFVGILPISVARLKAARAALRVLPIKPVGPRVSAEIVFVKNRTLSPAVESFVNCVRDVVNASRVG